MDEKTLHITRTALGTPPVEIPPPHQEYNIQRRGARVRLRTGTAAKLHLWDVTLIDLSFSGVLIEHTHRVQVGDPYYLSFQVDGLHTKARALAVRSFVSHRISMAGGERQIVYRTGMEFADLTADTTKRISAYLDRMRTSELAG
ncbi:MAG: PilZ domain-containing protein [Candidatus Methylomirabilales bacterium]